MVNPVDSGNHHHSVIRDFEHDFAHDSLRENAAHLAKHDSHLSTRTTSSEGTGLQANDWSLVIPAPGATLSNLDCFLGG